jgi:glycosyltransferase involved in cell wall biosynthesis
MAMGKAVICTRTTGQTDVVTDHENGLCVPPGDRNAMQEAITLLRGDKGLRRHLGENARRWVETNATLTLWVQRVADALMQAGESHIYPSNPSATPGNNPC